MTAPALPPEVEKARLVLRRKMAGCGVDGDIFDTLWSCDVAPIFAALGGDGEPVAWQRGCKPVGNRAVVEVCHTSDLEPDDVIFHEGEWFVVLDDDLNDSTQVWAAPILDDAGGRGEPDFCYGGLFVRCVPTRPAATGDTGALTEVEKARAAFYEAAMHAIGCRAAYGPDHWDAMNPSTKVHAAWRRVIEAEASAGTSAKGGA